MGNVSSERGSRRRMVAGLLCSCWWVYSLVKKCSIYVGGRDEEDWTERNGLLKVAQRNVYRRCLIGTRLPLSIVTDCNVKVYLQ